MIEPPTTRYAPCGDLSIAYQVFGEGDFDLVFIPGWISHVDLAWEVPAYARFMSRVARFARVIVFDKRGSGLSDPVHDAPTLLERAEDVGAVLDAVGSTRASLFGYSEGGPLAAVYAATEPAKVRSVVLYGTLMRGSALPAPVVMGLFDALEHWGDGRTLPLFAPSVPDTPAARHARGTFERAAMSPGLARALLNAVITIDVSDFLPSIRVPTLVLHRESEIIPVEHARWVASKIADAKYVELPGVDHQPWVGDADRVLAELEEFLVGHEIEHPTERHLATVIFSDIVGSTTIARIDGDRRWRERLEEFHALARRTVARRNGHLVKTIGDGLLARFVAPDDALRASIALHRMADQCGFTLRTGVHTGGIELSADGDVSGIAVHLAARVQAAAAPNEILVTRTVADVLEGSAFLFSDRGEHELKGIDGPRRLYAARPGADV